MYIADNILKYHLRNVYFLCGTACGGKTTMARALAQKYGFTCYNDDTNYDEHAKSIADPYYQPATTRTFDNWADYFMRPYLEYHQALQDGLAEQCPMILIDLIKLSADKPVVVDMHMPPSVAMSIAEPNRIAYLIASPQLVLEDYYDRDGHRDILACIKGLPEGDAALANCNKVLAYGTEQCVNQVKDSGVFYIERTRQSAVADTLRQLEAHFGLQP